MLLLQRAFPEGLAFSLIAFQTPPSSRDPLINVCPVLGFHWFPSLECRIHGHRDGGLLLSSLRGWYQGNARHICEMNECCAQALLSKFTVHALSIFLPPIQGVLWFPWQNPWTQAGA